MNTSQPTYSPRAAEIERNWRVIDATNRPLGRVASEAAHILRGKDKPSFTRTWTWETSSSSSTRRRSG